MQPVVWLFFLLIAVNFPSPATAANRFTILAYHDVRDAEAEGAGVIALRTQTLIEHFSWLREQGYRVVGLDQIVSAHEGREPLPEKAILLTFDDGYQSVYTQVYPLLKLFDYPAVIAPVGRWMETAPEERVIYGKEAVPREFFLSWPQVKEMVDSGLVEVASHSYDLHRDLIANPQGGEQPAATVRRYDPEGGRYETDEVYLQRLQDDLLKSVQVIEQHIGRKPRALIWPYGSYNRQTVDIAHSLGMKITMGLDSGPNDVADLSALRRILIANSASLSDLVQLLHAPARPHRIRVAQVDLDYLYDPDPKRQEQNLDLLLDRMQKLGINTVYLQAFADPDGNGSAEALYFPNRHLPMRADLFNRVAWQLRKRVGVQVYAWMPVLGFRFKEGHPLSKLSVQTEASKNASHGPTEHPRLSPFHPAVRDMIVEIYEDLAKQAYFSGLLFHDDAYLSDLEDAAPWALAFYAERWNLPRSIAEIRRSSELRHRWSRHKTELLVDWTRELADRVRKFRPEIKTARNLYAGVVMNPESEQWFSQSLPVFLKSYDYTAVMAMPYLEGAENPDQWLQTLVGRIAAVPGALERTVFELQSVDWKTKTPIGGKTLARQMRLLKRNGALNLGYYPDDFIKGYPEMAEIQAGISLSAKPTHIDQK
jgi:biofilm PGA synthesis lipoprotein PgaB